jgi:hypothetical protein
VGHQEPTIGSARMGSGEARVIDLWLGEDPSENRGVAPQSEALTVKAMVEFHEDVLDPAVSITLLNEHRQPVVVATTTEDLEETGGFKAGERAVFAFSLHNMLAPGRYYTILTITRRGEGVDVIDRYTGGLSFVVSGLAASGGMVEIPVETEVSRLGRAPQVEPAGGRL